MRAKVAIFCLLCCVFVTSVTAHEAKEGYAVLPDDAVEFVGIVTHIMPDPNAGAWLQVHVVFYYVMVWYLPNKITGDLPALGTKIHILAIYVGAFPYLGEPVSIYYGITWEVVDVDRR